MNWIWGGIGVLVGLWLASDRHLMGAVLGAAVVLLIVGQGRLRQRLSEAETLLQQLRSRPLAAPAKPVPAAEPITPPAAVVATAPAATTGPESIPPAAPVNADVEPVVVRAAKAEEIAEAPLETPAAPRAEARRAEVPPPSEPDAFERALGLVKRWFTEGNVPVKIGVLVLFAGVAAALRFAAAEGYFTLPIGLRLCLIAAGALTGLALGWRERLRRPAFGLSLQGGAIGVLLLTVFAAFRLYGLLPAQLAFALVAMLVTGAALLAVLQRAMALAVLGFLGGYLAPVLLSTGGGNHVALFSYYAVLNAAVFAISWRQHWRLLNLIGFVFTFGVGSAWGARSYRPELFWTVEPFLVLFFLFYVVIGLLYVLKQSEHRRPWLDGTLVFGTPLVAFPLQAALLRDSPMALACSAVVVAAIYVGLLLWLRRRPHERLLTEAYAALALGFVTLAVPLAFSAGTTASLWALEGVGVAWVGLRQARPRPWLSGLLLQLLAAAAYIKSEAGYQPTPDWLLLNSTWLGAAILGFAGMALALLHDRHRPQGPLPALLMLWGLCWWTFAAATQFDLARQQWDGWYYLMSYLAASLVLATVLRKWLDWPRLGWAQALAAGFGLLAVPWAADEYGAPLLQVTWAGWLAYFAAWGLALRLAPATGRSVALAHGLGLWTLAALATVQIEHAVENAAEGWRFLAMVTPLLVMSLGLWARPQAFAWPRAQPFVNAYSALWFGLALPLLAVCWLLGMFQSGLAEPLPYLPLINPLELSLAAISLTLWASSRERLPEVFTSRPALAAVAFAFVSMATLRAVHHGHGEPWSPAILDSGFTQTSLTVVWSLIGVAAWVTGSRRMRRPLWLAGAGLMGVVLLKLIAVDRQYMGNVPGIVSFMAVGLLLVAVGYFAPSPPKTEESN